MIGFAKVRSPDGTGATLHRGTSEKSEVRRELMDGTRIAILHEEGRYFFCAIENTFGYVLRDSVLMEPSE